MNILLNLKGVKRVQFSDSKNYEAYKVVLLSVFYYNNERPFEYAFDYTDLSETEKENKILNVKREYDTIKEALLNGDNYIEIEL